MTLIDYNDHMTESAYLKIFSEATDKFLETSELNASYLESSSVYMAETHLRHFKVLLHAPFVVSTQILGVNLKRICFAHEMSSIGNLLATVEQMLLHGDMINSRVYAFQEPLKKGILSFFHASKDLPMPDYVGKVISGFTL